MVQEIRAISGLGFTGAVRGRGRMRANPTRRMPYAAMTPKTSAAMDAQINIAKFNQSAIESASVNRVQSAVLRLPSYTANRFWSERYTIAVMRLSQKNPLN